MRKNQTLIIAVALFLCSAVTAQAQNTFVVVELVTQPEPAARMGGENEMSGSAWLTFSTADAIANTTVTLYYSVPLAGDMELATGTDNTSASSTVVGTAEDGDDNDGNGTVVVNSIAGDTTTLVIRNVMLDVSAASGPVTVVAEIESSDLTDFLRFDGPNVGTVISDIVVGVEAEADAETVRTRGTAPGGMMAGLTLKESFKDAFMMGNELEIEFSGIPDGASLTAEVTGILIADPDATPPVTTENDDPYATVGAVSSDGKATVMLGGDDMSIAANSDMRVSPDMVMLNLTLTAEADNDDISFPLDVGEVMAKVTFTDDEVNTFVDAFTDYVTVFMIRPAQCELLFPVVSVLPNQGNWDTAISVTNPAYEDEMASGGLTFTFYGIGNMEATYDTTIDGVTGRGLEVDGTLSPGSTYQVMASEILTVTNWGEEFIGHVHLKADYTNCSGLGWVTDFMTVNQAYSALEIDADTGTGTNE